MIPRPPSPPDLNGLNQEDALRFIKQHFEAIEIWQNQAYNNMRFKDLKDIGFTTSAAVPSGGQDGDVHIRVDGANTAISLNINGVWGTYTNP